MKLQPHLTISLTLLSLLLSMRVEAQEKPIELPRVPPRSLEEAKRSIEIPKGYELELAAAEPLVVDPVAIAFDAKGRMLVVEMIDYSEQDKESLGRLRRLEDSDGDGRMDRGETLAEGLSWPTALACTAQGTLVVHPPLMTLVREDGQGKFTSEVIAEGFHRNNVQGMANSFRWGIDNRWHLSTSSNGASLTGKGIQEKMELKGRDVSVDPSHWTWRSEPGGGQHGMDFNRWGDKFVASNSDHLQQVVAWDYPLSVASIVDPIQLRRSIAVDGPQADVFRLSPEEGWRTWRTHLRVSGKVPGPIEGGGRSAGYFTGATGVHIYDGDQWSDEDESFAIVADTGGNLVHRKKLSIQGLQWSGKRVDEGTEFMRSSDVWFRPVQFSDGPDGALYVIDMCREVIEHPASLPPMIKSQLDLTAGRDKGRIWRLRKKDRPIRRKFDPLDSLSTPELARLTDHPNGWHRETASRLLYERQDASAIPVLRTIAKGSSIPEGRLQALASLAGLRDGLNAELLEASIADPHPRVAEFAIRQLQLLDVDWKTREGIRMALQRRLSDPSLHVRMALASLGPSWLPPSDQASWWFLLGEEQWNNPELRSMVEWSSAPTAKKMLESVLASRKLGQGEQPWLRGLLFQTIQREGLSSLLDYFPSPESQAIPRGADERTSRSNNGDVLVSAFAETLGKHPKMIQEKEISLLRPWIQSSILPRVLFWIDSKSIAKGEDAQASMAMIGLLDVEQRKDLLHRILVEGIPASLQTASVQYLLRQDGSCFEIAVRRLDSLPPEAHAMVVRETAKRKETHQLILQALEQKKLMANQVPVDAWTMLLQHAGKGGKEKVESLRGKLSLVSWDEIAPRYRKEWDQSPDLAVGAALFKKHCSICHRIGTEGNEIGPGLASILSKSNDQLGLAIAEPSREVDPKYQVYQVLTTDGELVVGMMEEGGATSITIRDSRGERKVIERANMERFSTLGKSLMPDGLMEQLDPAAFNHLIGYIRATFTKTK